MKYYDKKLTKVSNNLKNIFFMLVVFVIGFLAGYFTTKMEKKSNENIQNQIQKNNEIYTNIQI